MSTRATRSLREADLSETARRPARLKRWLALAAVLGPGLMVMMADTDVGSVVTAAQSGAQWGFALLPLEFLLIPVLYIVQELTVRLGIFTGVGHGELICRYCGRKWGWISISGLVVAVFGAMITEFSGIAGVGDLLGIPRGVSLGLATLLLLVVVGLGSYRRVEKAVLALSLFELAFLWTALKARPHFSRLAELRMPLDNFDFRYLIAANIGAVIMPWMIFFQQSAVVDKRLRPKDLHGARWDTALGAVLTQAIMAAVLITAAVALRTHGDSRSLNTVGEITEALVPVLGSVGGRWSFSIGITGAACSAAGHGVGRSLGPRRNDRLRALTREEPPRSTMVLRYLCCRRYRISRSGRPCTRPGGAKRVGRGHERAAAPPGLGLPHLPRRPRAALATSAARSPDVDHCLDLCCHQRRRALVRHQRAVLRTYEKLAGFGRTLCG